MEENAEEDKKWGGKQTAHLNPAYIATANCASQSSLHTANCISQSSLHTTDCASHSMQPTYRKLRISIQPTYRKLRISIHPTYRKLCISIQPTHPNSAYMQQTAHLPIKKVMCKALCCWLLTFFNTLFAFYLPHMTTTEEEGESLAGETMSLSAELPERSLPVQVPRPPPKKK